jgi:hypothetical protein
MRPEDAADCGGGGGRRRRRGGAGVVCLGDSIVNW